MPTNPRRSILGCCVLAASGHAAAAPPRSVMNSRRFNLPNCIRIPPARLQDIELAGISQRSAECFYDRSWFCLRSQAAAPLRVRHDERADRAVITAAPEAYMAIASV